MLDQVKRFDMKRPPMRMHLRVLMWLLVLPSLLRHRNHLTKVNMEGVKPPYLLLCNHNAFMDFTVAIRAIWPHRANFVVAIDGFLKREWLLRLIGCICKRKFTRDATLVRHLRTVVARGDVAAIYPEARYSLCGTTAVLPESIGKLAKLLRVPVVTLICHGHHVNSPFWNLPDHGVRGTEATMTCLYTADALAEADAAEVTESIRRAFRYDDFRWQREKGLRIAYPRRAEGLHKVLYQCPHCSTEYRMASGGTARWCAVCGKRWRMTERGALEAEEGETEFSHIPDWYEWERANVRREVEAGAYCFTCRARVDALPNADGYIDLGPAELRHDMGGFHLRGSAMGEPYEVEIPAASLYSCHIEYDYLGKYGDCVDLNTERDTLYVYPEGDDFSVTKLALATEELYAHCHPAP
ncbi:MAG: 1-acyl-sn-glycerol-3-phosphate acyltransferase [Oscillospiraceae bacterium]|nr:1-acyl-sn-glycerol-3-phosphate acyltransferase [Oscillospiraceae bacterium]